MSAGGNSNLASLYVHLFFFDLEDPVLAPAEGFGKRLSPSIYIHPLLFRVRDQEEKQQKQE
jgi:hypothetical protein